MANPDPIITPAEMLGRLKPVEFNPEQDKEDDQFRRADLQHSILSIAKLNHESESEKVRRVAANVLGELPALEE